jgi:hypothetical protein
VRSAGLLLFLRRVSGGALREHARGAATVSCWVLPSSRRPSVDIDGGGKCTRRSSIWFGPGLRSTVGNAPRDLARSHFE